MLIQGGGAIAQHVKAGKLIALAVSTAERSKYYPGLPSIGETYPGFDSASWGAIFAPAATPKPVLDKLHATLSKLLADPLVRERLEAQSCDIPVVVGALAASREIYRIGMNCPLEKINEVWMRAIAQPIAPKIVDQAPCHDIVIQGAELDRAGRALDAIPLPISTPGWDIAPYTRRSQYITPAPETGVQNMGIYRGQLKAPRRLGMNPSLELRPGIYTHWQKAKKRGQKLAAAVVLGAPPCVAFTSAQKVPETIDELHVAGGLVGAPINVVKAKTVHLLVPAESEIVVEGWIDTEYLEPEAPFGESHGHVNLQEYNAFMEVTCITRRKDAILTSIISQVTPSESSLIKRVALEPLYLQHLRQALGIQGVKRVSMHEPLTNLRKVVVLILERNMPRTEIWRALYGAAAWNRAAGKYIIAVNEAIDPDYADALLWAMS